MGQEGEGEARQRMPFLHSGPGWVQAALQRAALVGWWGQVRRHLPRARRGTVKGGQAKNAPHSTRPKRLRDRVGNACVCRGGPNRRSPLPLLQGRTQNHLLRQGGRGTAEVGQAPPALQETSIPGEGWHKVSVPHQATLRRLPLAQMVGQQRAGSSKRTQLQEALLDCSLCGRRW